MNIFETHAHLDFPDFDKDRDTVIKEAQKAGVKRIINIGCDKKSSENSVKLSEKYPHIYASVGYHPGSADEYDENVIRALAKKNKVVAIGEIGLDYYRNYNPKAMMLEVFEKQVILAGEFGLPLIIHDREAHDDCYQILKKYKPAKVVFHCFSGDVSFAEKVLQEDWFISITGVVTYKNSGLADVIRVLPKDKFFIETDCPYLTPVPFRGKRNQPAYLTYVVQAISEILRVPPNKVADQSYQNACAFFGISG